MRSLRSFFFGTGISRSFGRIFYVLARYGISLSFDLTVTKSVENSGHLAGLISKEPLCRAVFSTEEHVVLARKKFSSFLVRPRVIELVTDSCDRTLALSPLSPKR